MKPVRLVVVDDHALFRSGLISLLGEMSEFLVVGEAGNGREALDVVRRTKPDVVLLDVNMPIMGGVETVQVLKKTETCRILMLTISKSDEDLLHQILTHRKKNLKKRNNNTGGPIIGVKFFRTCCC